MIPVALIRHAPTEWNARKRLQGRADQPLSEVGRNAAATWRVPPEFTAYDWYASPLSRAAETARLLGLSCATEPAIVEMHWGAWEGHTLQELEEKFGRETVANRTALGLDFRPHEGESPREVRARIARWFRRCGERGVPVGAVTHQGVIRAALSLATGWSMIGQPPFELDWASVHVFTVDESGRVEIERLNIGLK